MDPQIGSVIQFLDNKTVLITGATGFLAKILVEKILRVQPNVKKLYVLLRASNAKSAAVRFHNEVIEKDLFRVLKEENGTHFNSLISEKITLVLGDIALENLGVELSNVREEMWNELDVVIHSAATTNFDQRYDAALRINTFGVKHVMNFAKKCAKLKVLVHVSTAYVCGERSGKLYERSYRMGETLNGVPGLDMDEEMKIAEQELHELQAEGATEKAITLAMKDLGIKRAKVYGWPNTYVFTKAMGEMVVEHYKENIPAVIIRPTIVTSTYSDPFPGWVEGFRTIDSLAVAYGQGKLTCFLGDVNSVVDVIPADMTVNAILVAMVAHAEQVGETVVNVYQVGSSLRNPMRSGEMQEYGYRYFTQKPWISKKDGKPVKVGKVTVFHDITTFHRYMTFRYILPLKGLELANAASCQYFQETYHHFKRKINFVMRLVQVYTPYLFFNGIFDDKNTEKLRAAARENCMEADVFCFDPQGIDWEDYFMNTHIPGIVKYVFK